MNIVIGDRDVDQFGDAEIVAWLNDVVSESGGSKLREKTAALWLATMRAFDEAGAPMTVRQVYYALVSSGAIPKTENAYNRVCYHMLQMRRRNVIPYDFIADNTRWMRKPKSYTGLEAYLEYGKQAYRRAIWANQDAYVEVWCEKDALAGVLHTITERWDVPLMVTRGYPSESFVFEAAQVMMRQSEMGKKIYLYYFGDHDPSGKDIPESTREKLRGFGARFYFQQVAVLPWQIEQWGLPTRPTKRTDTRAKGWVGGSVELDAIPARTLKQLTEQVITRHINDDELEATRKAEKEERKAFDWFMENFRLAPSLGGGGQRVHAGE